MSGRIRQLKPEFFLDEEFWAFSEAHPTLHLVQAYQGLWCHADREGRFEWRPAKLKAQILPYWGGDFTACLDALVKDGYVLRYEVGGRWYGQIRSFLRHQRPGNREPVSIIPECPPLKHAQAGDACVLERAEASRASLPTPIPRSRSIPLPQPAQAATLVSRAMTMPTEHPTQEYLDSATMAGLHPDQARSTWRHYWTAGLPERGVEKLVPWLVKQALERARQTARAGPQSRGGSPPTPSQVQAERVRRLRAEEDLGGGMSIDTTGHLAGAAGGKR